MKRSSRASGWLCLGVLVACDTEPSTPGLIAEAAPAVATPTAPPEPVPTPHPAEQESAPDPRWTVVAKSPQRVRLHALDGATFASTGPRVVRLRRDGRVDDDLALRRDIATFADPGPHAMDLTHQWRVVTLGGRWPDAAYLVIEASTGGRGGEFLEPFVHRWSSDRWAPESMRGYPDRVRTWSDGEVLALRRFRGGGGPLQPDKLEQVVVLRGASVVPSLGAEFVLTFDSLPSGEITAITSSLEHPVIARHRPDMPLEQQPLPGAGGANSRLDLRLYPDRDAVVFGGIDATDDWDWRPYLAHRRGDTWVVDEDCPCQARGGTIVSLVESAAGSWAVCGDVDADSVVGGSVEFRTPGDSWREQSLGDRFRISTIVDDGGTLWASAILPASSGSHAALLRYTADEVQPVEWPDLDAIHQELLEWSDLAPSQDCETIAIVVEDTVVTAQGIAAKLDAAMSRIAARGSIELLTARYRGQARSMVVMRGVYGPTKVRRASQAIRAVGSARSPVCFAPNEDVVTVRAWGKARPDL